MTKMTFSPQLLKKTFFNKEMSTRRWEAVPKSPPPRRVAFSENDTVFSVLARSDMSDEEKSNSWYSRQEFRTIRDDNNRIIKDIRAGKCDNHCVENEARGLEYKVRQRADDRETRRMESLIAVLEEQDFQEEIYGLVIYDHKIAKVYAQTCVHCLAEAIHMAAVDAAIVHGHCEMPLSCETKPPTSKKRSLRRRVFPVLNTKRQNLQ